MKTFATLSLLMLSATLASAANLVVTGFEITTSEGVDIGISKQGRLLYISPPEGELKRDDAGRIVQAGSVRIVYENDGTIGTIGNSAIKRDMAGTISSIGDMAVTWDSDGTIIGIGSASIQRADNGTISSVAGDPRVRPVLSEPQIKHFGAGQK